MPKGGLCVHSLHHYQTESGFSEPNARRLGCAGDRCRGEEIRRVARQHRRRGADVVKIFRVRRQAGEGDDSGDASADAGLNCLRLIYFGYYYRQYKK